MSEVAPRPAWGKRVAWLVGLGFPVVLVALFLGYGVSGCLCASKEETAKAQVAGVGQILAQFKEKTGSYPASLHVLADGRKAKLKPENLRDPWRQELEYRLTTAGFELCSAGPDTDAGTVDDVCYGREVR